MWLKFRQNNSKPSKNLTRHHVLTPQFQFNYLLVVGILTLYHSIAAASIFEVNTTADEVDVDINDGICLTASATCSLRAAIQQSNATPGNDRINLSAGTYQLLIAGANEDNAATGDLDIKDHLSIVGAGGDVTIIDAANNDRAFDVFGSWHIEMSQLSIVNGHSVSGRGGGAIRLIGFDSPLTIASQSVYLRNVMLSSNRAESGRGGAIYCGHYQTLYIEDSILDANKADSDGGAVYSDCPLQVLRSSITNNNATGMGGAINSSAALYLFRSVVDGNTGSGLGGGIVASSNLIFHGGDVSNNKVFYLNTSTVGGNAGGIAITDLGGSGSSGKYAYAGYITFDSNTALGSGGALRIDWTPPTKSDTVNLIGLSISNNIAGQNGGGLFLTALDLLSDTQVVANLTKVHGGGMYLAKGAISNLSTIRNSAFIDNRVRYNDTSLVSADPRGGGLQLGPGDYTIVNSTISGNRAESSVMGINAYGGGLDISNTGGHVFNLTASTIVNNQSSLGGNNLNMVLQDGASIDTSIIHDEVSASSACRVSSVNPVMSLGYNVFADATCATPLATDIVTTQTVVDALDPLTSTHAGLALAQQKVPADRCQPTDQRNYKRGSSACDIGAFDVNAISQVSGHAQFSASSYRVAESDASVSLSLQRVGGVDGELSVDVLLLPDSARSDATIPDFDDTIQTVSWADQDASDKTVSVAIGSDLLVEGSEQFVARLLPLRGDDDGLSQPEPQQAVVTIDECNAGIHCLLQTDPNHGSRIR